MPSALAGDGDGPTALAAAGKVVSVKDAANGAKRLTYRVGPFNIKPGQNEIGFEPIVERPQVNGWITRMRPDLVYADGTVPSVDVIHLHHGVWLNLGRQDATSALPGALPRGRRGEDDRPLPEAVRAIRTSRRSRGSSTT